MKYYAIFFVFLFAPTALRAQCAMCKATVEGSMHNGGGDIVAGLNAGILYLFLAPYFFLGILAFFWYRTSKRKQLLRRR